MSLQCPYPQLPEVLGAAPGVRAGRLLPRLRWLRMAPLGPCSTEESWNAEPLRPHPQRASCYSAGISLGLTLSGS